MQKRLKQTVVSITREFAIAEQELNELIRIEAEALIKTFQEARAEIAAGLGRGAGEEKRKGTFCPLSLRHKHKPGGTHTLAWGHVYLNDGQVRTRSVKKPARGTDYTLTNLIKQAPAAFSVLIETTEQEAVELRRANRLLVKVRETIRLMKDESTTQLPTPDGPE